MTETEWSACDDSRAMFAFVGERMTQRRRRLFSHACGRRHCRVWPEEMYTRIEDAHFWLARKPQIDRLCSRVIDAADEQCDGVDRAQEIKSLRQELGELAPLSLNWDIAAALKGDVAYWVKRRFEDLPSSSHAQASLDATVLWELHAEYTFQAALIRDVCSNPFRPAPAPVACIAWNDAAIPKMTQAIYADRAFDRLPLLADALEDAGCTDAAILTHCRQQGEHVRGCWVVDLLLGKS